MRILSATVGPLQSASVNAIATSQSGVASTALTLTSSPYTLDTPRRIIITSAGDDHLYSVTISGTNWVGIPVTEVLSLTNASAAQSLYDYASITSVVPNHATSSLQVGTNGVASTVPLFLDRWGYAPTSIQVDVTGTVSATVQQTLDDCNGTAGFTAVNWINHPDSNLVNLSTNVQGNYAYLPQWVRLVLNSGTGSATIKVLQAGPIGNA